MIGRFAVAALSLCIGACASSGPEAPAPQNSQPPATVDVVAEPDPNDEGFYALEVPAVQQVAGGHPMIESDQIICRRMRLTGTKFARKVCGTRAEFEARAVRDQEMWREMQK